MMVDQVVVYACVKRADRRPELPKEPWRQTGNAHCQRSQAGRGGYQNYF